MRKPTPGITGQLEVIVQIAERMKTHVTPEMVEEAEGLIDDLWAAIGQQSTGTVFIAMLSITYVVAERLEQRSAEALKKAVN